MDKQFTLKLQEWLNTPAEERDLEVGATLLLQLTNNKILYRNIKSNLKGHADFIEFKLKRYLQYRLQELTHEEVEAMQKQVDGIVGKFALDKAKAPSKKGKAPKSEAQEWKGGKRADHDTLPDEIQALYVENASIMQKMRELHLQLRNLSTQASTWQAYDSFTVSSDAADTGSGETAPTPAAQADAKPEVGQQTLDETARLEQKNILRQINLAKGRYKKNPSEKLKDSILALYKQLTAPSDALNASLKELGIL